MTTWRLLLTRSEQDNAPLSVLLAGQGIASLGLPLLDIEPLEESAEQRSLMLDLDRYSTVVVVSKNAARLGLERVDRYWPQPPARQAWFAVGPSTARVLEDYGLDVAYPQQGDDSEALWADAAFQHSISQPAARVLIMRATEGRDWLGQQLLDQGVAVDYLPLYQVRVPDYPLGRLQQCLAEGRINGIVVSSGQALLHLHRLAGGEWQEVAGLTLFVPSRRVAEQALALGARDVVNSEGAGSAALLRALAGRSALPAS